MQINAFPDLVVLEQGEEAHALQEKTIKGDVVSGERDGQTDAVDLTFRRLTLASF